LCLNTIENGNYSVISSVEIAKNTKKQVFKTIHRTQRVFSALIKSHPDKHFNIFKCTDPKLWTK